jgi:hypothetical protein
MVMLLLKSVLMETFMAKKLSNGQHRMQLPSVSLVLSVTIKLEKPEAMPALYPLLALFKKLPKTSTVELPQDLSPNVLNL